MQEIKTRRPETETTFQLSSVFSTLGMPDDILLQLLPDTPAGTPWFSLYLFYQSHGVTLSYGGDTTLAEEELMVCSDMAGPDFVLVSPGSKALYWMKRDADNVDHYVPPLNKYPGTSIEIFYEALKEPES